MTWGSLISSYSCFKQGLSIHIYVLKHLCGSKYDYGQEFEINLKIFRSIKILLYEYQPRFFLIKFFFIYKISQIFKSVGQPRVRGFSKVPKPFLRELFEPLPKTLILCFLLKINK